MPKGIILNSQSQSRSRSANPGLELNSTNPIPPLFLFPIPPTMFLFSFIILISSFHLAQPFQLYHRVLHPSLPEGPFLKRGSILDTTGNPRILSTSTVLQHGLPLAETSAHVTDALYQLALDPGSKSDSLWLMSSIKAVIPYFIYSQCVYPLTSFFGSATLPMLPMSTLSSISPPPEALHSPSIISSTRSH